MGFWGSLGKGLLKVAPIATAFIPGIGPLASAAISAGTSAAAKKASGGSWKDTLKAGVIGALPTKGIGPTGSVLNKITKGAIENVKGTAAQGQGRQEQAPNSILNATKGLSWDDINRQAGGLGPTGAVRGGTVSRGEGMTQAGGTTPTGGKGGVDWKKLAGIGAGIAGGIYGAKKIKDAAKPDPYMAPTARYGSGNYEGTMRGLGPVMGRRNQNFPNLAESIGAGRQEAIRSQPFRKGYDMTTQYYGPEPANDEEGNVGELITETRRMPKIYPTGGRRAYR